MRQLIHTQTDNAKLPSLSAKLVYLGYHLDIPGLGFCQLLHLSPDSKSKTTGRISCFILFPIKKEIAYIVFYLFYFLLEFSIIGMNTRGFFPLGVL